MHESLPFHPTLRHPRTGLPLQAVGIIADQPVWPVMGAEDTPPAPPPAPDTPPAPTPPETPPTPPEEEPADKTDWKAEARKWEARAKESRDKAKKFDDLDAASKTELEKAQAERDSERAKAEAATARAVKAEVRSLADKFNNRDDAVVHMAHAGDLSRFLDDNGDVDTKAISKALGDFLKDRPDLAKPEAPAKPGGKPVANLRPGAAPASGERAASLEDAIAARYQNT